MRVRLFALLLLLSCGAVVGLAQAASTLEAVKQRGHLRCGVSQGLPGFSTPDGSGGWTGLDVDFCRAVAAAVLGDADKVRFAALSAKERFTALQSGEVDLLARNTTWTLSRDAELGFHFVGVLFYDGQGFMVPKELGVTSVAELDGATICSNAGTTTELNLADWFRARGMDYQPVVFEKSDEVAAAYDAGRCDAYTTDRASLYAQRNKLKNPDAHVILPELISKEPLGPLVRRGDDQWFSIVKWTLYVLIGAEELGLTSANVEEQRQRSRHPEVQRLLSVNGNSGQGLGLGPDWAYNIIRQVGNYGELYQRNLGRAPLGIERGLNALYTDGGLMYAPPFR
ncbi:MAG: amino acid ABC transporter substrate-binding protein [Xanthomonadaceae bacterium]|nr:amino acid ABC transporter substrate-binding protein [Xanthomonadaceae bacterium]